MGAKITLTGTAKQVEKGERSVSFCIVAGPETQHPPRGLRLFGQTHYQVECTLRQWRRARLDLQDESDLVIEGYLEPRREGDTGRLYVAVVATEMQSELLLSAQELERLQEALQQARQAFQEAKETGARQEMLEARASAFVQANECVDLYLQRHPELVRR
jgi:hypothetical protein